VSAFTVELMFDRGRSYEKVEAETPDDATRIAMERHKSAFGARIWRKPMSREDREHYGDIESQKADADSYTPVGHAAEVE
jgi:hypothetical protein